MFVCISVLGLCVCSLGVYVLCVIRMYICNVICVLSFIVDIGFGVNFGVRGKVGCREVVGGWGRGFGWVEGWVCSSSDDGGIFFF